MINFLINIKKDSIIMKVPLEWLKNYTETDLQPVEIAKTLTQMGLEVDAIHIENPKFSNIVVGEVISTEKHPNADSLCIAKVSDGTDTYQVVCGAPNCRAGLKTALAKVGALLPDEGDKTFKIKKSKLRGIESEGMLCSYSELQLSDSNEGIIEFDSSLVPGQSVADLFKQTIFEISLTPNLGHCANILGVARELHAATQSKRLTPPNFNIEENSSLKIEDYIKVAVENKEECMRYSCRVILDVTIAPSPLWLQNRLIASGFRPVNNIVDITNYVLLELGQPLHAFDYDLIKGKELLIEKAKEEKSFISLDGKERLVHQDDLLIYDKEKPLAIAGVIGGQNSEVTNETKNILLESAYFCAGAIRKTSKRLGIMTEASRRFERGCDPNMVDKALNRAAMLMKEIAGGKVVQGMMDIKNKSFEEKIIACRVSRANRILGTQLTISEIESIFKRLGFNYEWDNKDTFNVIIPTYRVDINYEVDLIEEIARIYGFENLTKTKPYFNNSTLPNSPVFLFEREVRARMISEGLQEFLTCDLIGPTLMEIAQSPKINEDSLIKVLNPVSIEQSYLRTSLLPGLLQVVKSNSDFQNENICGFEIGRVHFREGIDKYKEDLVLGIILVGDKFPDTWSEKNQKVDFFDLKGIIENLLYEFGIEDYKTINNELNSFHTGRQASLYVDSLEIGTFGEIHPTILRKLGLSQRVYFGEFNLEDIYNKRKIDIQMKKISKYPCSERDWTLSLNEDYSYSNLKDLINSVKSDLLEDFQIRDVYRSSKLGDGIKNVTLRFVYRDHSKTISQESVDQEHTRMTDKIRSLLTV